MDILFANKKLEKECNNRILLDKKHGTQQAKLIAQRLVELRAADTLADMLSFPRARCHELTQNRAGQLAVDLDQPYRLIFEPAYNPVPKKADGGLDWANVTAIRVIEVTDYH